VAPQGVAEHAGSQQDATGATWQHCAETVELISSIAAMKEIQRVRVKMELPLEAFSEE
jgi:hypothetical protein